MSLRERTPSGLGIIEPCLPSPAKVPPSGPKWIHKIKHDGIRILARRNGAGVRLITRHGNDFTARFPLAVEAVTRLPANSFLLDGEAIVTNDRSLAGFDLIRHKRHGADAVLIAFDLIELDGEDLRRMASSSASAKWPSWCAGLTLALCLARFSKASATFSLPTPVSLAARES
jgi:bifunctional non-homologous end joining protein LigD